MKANLWRAIVTAACLEVVVLLLEPPAWWAFVMAVLAAAVQETLRREEAIRDASPTWRAHPLTGGRPPMVCRAIIDITKANPGTERRLVEAVLEQHHQQFTERPLVLGFDSHQSVLGSVTHAVDFRSAGAWQAETEVNRQLAQEVQAVVAAGPPGTLLVFTFHHSVLNKQNHLAPFGHLFETVTLRGYSRVPGYATEWPEELMPLDEAIQHLINALRQVGASPGNPVYKTNIRHLLEIQDRRFNKTSHPAAAQPGLISVLLEKARARQVVEL
ncbi:MAG TPA: hypothetical protein VHJ17_21870, partial [Thermomonospora sp.]|nr:hypothetical protein [Thermomonospora sp.]